MPHLIYAAPKGEVIVTSFVQGICLKESEDALSYSFLAPKIMEAMKQIHSITDAPMCFCPSTYYPSWYALFYASFNKCITTSCQTNLLSEEELKKLYRFMKSLKAELSIIPTTFVHGDVKFANMIYQPKTEKVVFIDYENAFVGDPDYDHTRLFFPSSIPDQIKITLPTLYGSDKYLLYRLKVLTKWYVFERNKVKTSGEIPATQMHDLLKNLYPTYLC